MIPTDTGTGPLSPVAAGYTSRLMFFGLIDFKSFSGRDQKTCRRHYRADLLYIFQYLFVDPVVVVLGRSNPPCFLLTHKFHHCVQRQPVDDEVEVCTVLGAAILHTANGHI